MNYFINSVEVSYHPKSGKAQGGMSVRFWKRDKVSLYVDLQNQIMKTFIPFTGKEKVCWDCGGNREIVLETDFDGNFLGQKEVCDK